MTINHPHDFLMSLFKLSVRDFVLINKEWFCSKTDLIVVTRECQDKIRARNQQHV